MEMDFRMMGEWLPHFPSDMEATACSRPLLENSIYRRLAANPHVTFRPHTDVLQLCAGDDGRQVRGVYLGSRAGGDVEELAANLIVDTSGRDSKAPEWLKRLGYAAAKEISINSFAGYATRVFRAPADFADTWKVMYIMPQPHEGTRGGVILPLEGGQWHVTLIGVNGDYPATDEESFYEFARSLPSSRLYDAIKDAEPVGPIYGYRRAENRLRQYDQLPQYLEGFLLLGDSVFALNPVYGQGMTVAAIAAMTLGETITDQRRRSGNGDLTGLAMRFQQQLGKVLAMPWQTATNEDMRWPKTEGGHELDLPTRLIQKYFSQVMRAAPHNPIVTDAFYRIQHMVTPPTTILRPDMMARVFTTNLAVRFSKS
jgi:flavin-dependent dehydrogenase